MNNPWGSRCWLLTSPRTGSTWLQFLLNKNAGVPLRITEDLAQSRFSFGEHMSEKYCHSLEDFFAWDPIVSKVHCHHFGAYIVDRPLLKSRMPQVRFVLLERKDRVAQAVSLAMSNCTSVTQCANRETQHAYHQRRITLADAELLACYRAVGDYRDFWKNWLHSEPHLVVTYEALIEDPTETTAQIFDYLRTPCPKFATDIPLRKLEHPQTTGFVLRLHSLIANCQERSSMVCTEEEPKYY